MPETLYGTDAIIAIVLDKVELAVRRSTDNVSSWADGVQVARAIADEIAKITKEMRS